jgi:hypothetical protein
MYFLFLTKSDFDLGVKLSHIVPSEEIEIHVEIVCVGCILHQYRLGDVCEEKGKIGPIVLLADELRQRAESTGCNGRPTTYLPYLDSAISNILL